MNGSFIHHENPIPPPCHLCGLTQYYEVRVQDTDPIQRDIKLLMYERHQGRLHLHPPCLNATHAPSGARHSHNEIKMLISPNEDVLRHTHTHPYIQMGECAHIHQVCVCGRHTSAVRRMAAVSGQVSLLRVMVCRLLSLGHTLGLETGLQLE